MEAEKESSMKHEIWFLATAGVILSIVSLSGCRTAVIRPAYVPQGVFHLDFAGEAVKLVVRDERTEDDKVFLDVGLLTLYERSKGDVELEPSSQEILYLGLRQAMTSSGYLLCDDAAVIVDVTVLDFAYRLHARAHPPYSEVNIELGISVAKDRETLLRKVIAERTVGNVGNEGPHKWEQMFSDCLSKTVEKVVSDYNVISAVKMGYKAK